MTPPPDSIYVLTFPTVTLLLAPRRLGGGASTGRAAPFSARAGRPALAFYCLRVNRHRRAQKHPTRVAPTWARLHN